MLTHFMRWARYSLIGAALFLSACHSTGNNFKSAGISQLEPGVSSFADAVEYLEADPVNRYYGTNGTYMARWAHVNSLLPDGVYMNRELWLDFDANNQFIRISKRHNVQSAIESTPQVEY